MFKTIRHARSRPGARSRNAFRSSVPFIVVFLLSVQVTARPWPGADDTRTVDPPGVFQENLSGLSYESGRGSGSGGSVLWGVQNRPGMLFRMVSSGTGWVLDPSTAWKSGRLLRYPDGKGSPDAEGITLAGTSSAAGIYVSTERDNDVNSRSRNSVLRFDPNQSGTALTATNEWNLTADLPRTGGNEGIEAIAWVPDSYLVERKFHDEAAGRVYNPADYPNHGDGLFFIGLESNGEIYAYALNHSDNSFSKIATVKSTLAHLMVLEYDHELKHLWAVCDNNCGTRAAILQIGGAGSGANAGRFAVTRIFDRPKSLPNVNNEGFAVSTQSDCRNGNKPVFWSDDSDTGGHSIRSAGVTCTPFAP